MPASLSTALRHPVTVKRAIKIAAIVGTLLILINQGHLLLVGDLPPLWKIIATYLVPYSVSSYSTAIFMIQNTPFTPLADKEPS